MGAHPKNKITRVEQGKRRAGNTPKLAKNKAHTAVPAHKKGLFARFTQAVAGAVTKPAKKAPQKTVKFAAKAAEGETMPAKKKAVKKTVKKAVKAVKKTVKKAVKKTVKKATKKKAK